MGKPIAGRDEKIKASRRAGRGVRRPGTDEGSSETTGGRKPAAAGPCSQPCDDPPSTFSTPAAERSPPFPASSSSHRYVVFSVCLSSAAITTPALPTRVQQQQQRRRRQHHGPGYPLSTSHKSPGPPFTHRGVSCASSRDSGNGISAAVRIGRQSGRLRDARPMRRAHLCPITRLSYGGRQLSDGKTPALPFLVDRSVDPFREEFTAIAAYLFRLFALQSTMLKMEDASVTCCSGHCFLCGHRPFSDVTDADYMNEHAPPPAPYYPYPALHKEHPTTLAGALACLAGRPMLFSSAPLLSPPDKAGAE
ncbi:hypothetical protein EAG_00861 [Camponotus floridanus]|uniref:Uncharacterized protein n=1 Tax=Camponotus floridanus TaxID=104421 RepID=E2AQ97_CAMFO|nr:hypothetical protein EAG_00861 [Camponotus floridanus]